MPRDFFETMQEYPRLKIRRAAEVIQSGGIVAYPTEAVFGLGCDPADQNAVRRILKLKQRAQQAGVILIAANGEQLDRWIAPTAAETERMLSTNEVVTWIVTARPHTPPWITGGRDTIAVRITQHPVAGGLCNAAGRAIVSTSANRHGHPPARTALAVRCKFGAQIDYIMPGATGAQLNPTEIRNARTGAVLRPA
jgi:L-threonylcarbamoyladenylate synthase